MDALFNSLSKSPFYYAAFLVLSGLCGYLLGPLHASTALIGGVGGGLIVAALSLLNRRKVLWAHPALRTAIGVFALTFFWRGVGAWQLVFKGNPDYLPISVLLSLMCVVSISMLVYIFKSR